MISARSKPPGNQVVDKGKFIIIEIFALINEQRLLELKYQSFVTEWNNGYRQWSSLVKNVTKRVTLHCVPPDENPYYHIQNVLD